MFNFNLNSDVIRAGVIPCETNQRTGDLSRTLEPFHDVASVTVGQFKGSKRHVCTRCANLYHKHQKRVEFVIWD